MQRWIFSWVILLWMLPVRVSAQTTGEISILYPVDQQVLQGLVEIQVNSAVNGVQSYELLFGYSGDPQERNLFLLAQGNAIPDSQPLYGWDTTLIPDGNYRLVFRVIFTNGERQEAIVETVKVRNYSVAESPTVSDQTTTTSGVTLPPPKTPTPIVTTPTPSRPNPGSVQPAQWSASVIRGVSITILLFILIGGLIRSRKPKKRR